MVFNHLFLYGIIGVERCEFLLNELRKIMGLDEGYKVIKVEKKKKGKAVAKYIYVEPIVKKYKCPKCGKYTKSIHDKLKQIVLKYVKAFEFLTYVVLIKRRFICHNCKYKFTKPVTI